MCSAGFGLIGNITISIKGGLVGGWLATSLLIIEAGLTGINLSSILTAFAGAVILIFILQIIRGNRV